MHDEFLNNFKRNYKIEDVYLYLDKLRDLNILIIGETIIDVYQYGNTLGKAGKFPIVAFEEQDIETYDGGVLAIRNHLKEFCKVDIRTGWKQIIKKRYIQEEQKLFETYSYKGDLGYDESKPIENYDMVIVADFGHGFITNELKEEIQSKAAYIALNTQNNSGNMGMNTLNKYNRWDYASIDDNELRLACSNQFDDIKQLMHDRFNGLKRIVSVTENKYGSYVYKDKTITHIPAFAKDIVDTVGAGDAYLSITSPLAYLNAPIEIIGFIGNIAGAIACTYPGNKEYVTKDKMYKFIEKLYEK